MPERNPREWQIRVCACGREQVQGELGAGVCWHHWDPDGEQFGLEMDRVYTVEDLGPERMLAWAIDRLRGPDTTLAAERLTGHVRLTLPRGRHIDDGGLDVEITGDGHPVEITWTEKSDDFHGTATRCIVLSESELLTIIAEWAALRGDGDA